MGSLEARVVALCDAVKLLSLPFYDFEYHALHPTCSTSGTPNNTTSLRPHPWSESQPASFELRLPTYTATGIDPAGCCALRPESLRVRLLNALRCAALRCAARGEGGTQELYDKEKWSLI